MPFSWDIRDPKRTPPHTDPDSLSDDDKLKELQAQIQVNVMVFLTEGVPYDEMYSRNMKKWFPGVLDRVRDEWPEDKSGDAPEALQTLILTEFGKVKDALNDLNGEVQFGDLWIKPEERLRPAGDYDALFAPFKRLVEDPTYGFCFCFPFVTLAPNNLVTRAQMKEHVTAIGDLQLRSLYELPQKVKKNDPKDPDELTPIGKKVKKGKENGIFSGKADRLTVTGGGGGNFRRCNDLRTSCITSTSGWCNVAADGSCISG